MLVWSCKRQQMTHQLVSVEPGWGYAQNCASTQAHGNAQKLCKQTNMQQHKNTMRPLYWLPCTCLNLHSAARPIDSLPWPRVFVRSPQIRRHSSGNNLFPRTLQTVADVAAMDSQRCSEKGPAVRAQQTKCFTTKCAFHHLYVVLTTGWNVVVDVQLLPKRAMHDLQPTALVCLIQPAQSKNEVKHLFCLVRSPEC